MTVAGEPITGGCQCGKVRYVITGRPDRVHLCHCRMCQKALGNVFAALAPIRKADLSWTSGAPKEYPSSDAASRGFCSDCGTPLTFRRHDSDWINVTIGSLDVPNDVPPTFNYGVESRVTWLHDIFDLDDFETSSGGVTGREAE